MATAEYTPSPFPCSIVVVQTTGHRGKTFNFERKNWCVLGANKDCDIIVPFPGVAQLQALIHVKRNGVFLQGIDGHYPVRHPRLQKELLNEEEVLLLPEDVFLLGNRAFLIEYSAEDLCIEAHNMDAQARSNKRSSSRAATPRPRRRRKSSIMVGEYDETYVLPTNGSETLLSKTQLARASQGEVEVPSQCEDHSVKEDRESLQPQVSSQKLGDEDLLSHYSSSSDDSTVLSDEQASVSRSIDFDPINEGAQKSKTSGLGRVSKMSTAKSNEASQKKQRRKMVFDRLSKGLPATPRRTETQLALIHNDPRPQKPIDKALPDKVSIASGKENVPLCEISKSSKKEKNKAIDNAQSVRSPLANRGELENHATPPTHRNPTPVPTGLLASARSKKLSAQTPRSRSVAFATAIELAPGAHYSPFRPRKLTTMSGSGPGSKRHVPEKIIRSAPRVPRTRSSVASSSATEKQVRLLKTPANNIEPTTCSKILGKAAESEKKSTDTHWEDSKPVVEYDDDSNPPTPSSSEEESESCKNRELSEPSPMARVGGALAGFLKRLSGNLESDQDGSSSEADEDCAHKRLSFSEDVDESTGNDLPCSRTPTSVEPVMSSSELNEMSQRLLPEQREDFVNSVMGAAKDVREATRPICIESNGQNLSSDEEIAVCRAMAAADEAIKANACPEMVGPEGDQIKSYESSCESDSTGTTTSRDESEDSPEGTLEDIFNDEDGVDGTKTPVTPDLPAISRENSIDSDKLREPESLKSSTSELSSSATDMPDFEVELQVLRSTESNDRLDDSEDENGVEIDYGDDPWDDLDSDQKDGSAADSDEREVAAVLVDDEIDIQNTSISGYARSCEDVITSEKSEEERSTSGEEGSSHEASLRRCSTARVSEGLHPDKHELGHERLASDSSHDTSDEFTQMARELMSHQARKNAHMNPGADETAYETAYETASQESTRISPTKSMEDEARKTNPTHAKETEAEFEAFRRDLTRLKKDELKTRLIQRGLNVEGLKKDLVERLACAMITAAMNSEGEEAAAIEADAQSDKESDPEMLDMTQPSKPSVGHMTPRSSRTKSHCAEIDSEKKNLENSSSSSRKLRVSDRRLTRQSHAEELTALPSPQRLGAAAETKSNIKSEVGQDISLYRRRTVRELRQFLKDRGLDTQQKMRKDELIQHLITLSIGSDGQDFSKPDVLHAEKNVHSVSSDSRYNEKPQPKKVTKSSQKMTVSQIRAQLGERGQCRAGTKKTLLERLSTQPERRTRSRRVLDATSCASCQAGSICEAAPKD